MSRLLWTAAALAGMFSTEACSRGTPQSPSASAPATHAAEGELQRMTVDELAGMLARNEPVTIVDNNGRARYEQGHIPGARWVGHDEVTAAALPADRNARVVFYCYNEH